MMNFLELQADLLLTAVPLWASWKGLTHAATGVLVQAESTTAGEFVPFLVTPAELVSGADRLVVGFKQTALNPSADFRRQAEIPGEELQQFVDSSSEIAVIPADVIVSQLEAAGKAVEFRSITKELLPPAVAWRSSAAFEQVTVICYPEFIPHHIPRVPVARRGITATPLSQDYNGTPSFLIDIGMVPGLSGSPVFVERSLSSRAVSSGRFEFAGIIVEGMYAVGLGVSVFSRAVKSNAIFDHIAKTAKRPRSTAGA